ncbi:MAG: energy transducer TonB [Syntrophobacteraceae bacterium]
MESLTLSQRRVHRNDLLAGIGGSFLVHMLLFSAAFIGAWVMPHKPIKPPFCTVNLVSLQDIGTGSTAPKGSPKAPDVARVTESTRSAAKATGKAEPAVPVKRLQLDEPARKHETPPIKKIEPKEAPKLAETPQSLAAIEKNLDKLIAKPKVVPRTSTAIEQTPASQEKTAVQKPAVQEPPANRPTKGAQGGDTAARGTPTGSAEGGAKGTVQGSTSGSPEGSTAVSALTGMYGEKVKEKIQREWRLVNDQGIAGLKTVIEVHIQKSGEVLKSQVLKTSGNSLFDDSAVRAVQRAAPMPPVPESIQINVLRLTFQPGRVS